MLLLLIKICSFISVCLFGIYAVNQPKNKEIKSTKIAIGGCLVSAFIGITILIIEYQQSVYNTEKRTKNESITKSFRKEIKYNVDRLLTPIKIQSIELMLCYKDISVEFNDYLGVLLSRHRFIKDIDYKNTPNKGRTTDLFIRIDDGFYPEQLNFPNIFKFNAGVSGVIHHKTTKIKDYLAYVGSVDFRFYTTGKTNIVAKNSTHQLMFRKKTKQLCLYSMDKHISQTSSNFNILSTLDLAGSTIVVEPNYNSPTGKIEFVGFNVEFNKGRRMGLSSKIKQGRDKKGNLINKWLYTFPEKLSLGLFDFFG